MDTNVVVMVGRLVRDMERKISTTGTSIGRFSLANNYRKKNGQEYVDDSNYFDCVLIGKAADAVAQYMTKGRQVSIEGELRQQRWEQDGQNRSKVEIIVNNLQLLSTPQNEQKPAAQPAPQPAPSPSPDGRRGPESFVDDEDVIPF